ncbi:DUF3307 domain-containing protein [Dethiobacter alkaliphilus]|uniref:DUF3307 domain-containing protein n=1 Tax=Dethiobacter alkaliphilus TaxID=427926 RepID=UPI002227F59A|nr:DUF3307 domain-containing protein [Dethiobacter alkaliphilus]MCW3490503.1 DUF3307 domain-containing protein [Dethiobacter alkaliphilus]
MTYSFFLSLFLAHLFGDFPLQAPSLCRWKFSHSPGKRAKSLRRHTMIHASVGFFAAIHYLWTPYLLLFLLLYVGFHYLIDLGKIKYGTDNLYSFFLDQLVHLLLILLLTLVFRPTIAGAPWLESFIHAGADFALLNRILASLVLLSMGLWVTGVFIRIYINSLKNNTYSESTGITDGGYLIGILERLLVITMVATNNAAWASLVLGVKSIARFRKFEDDAFVEYFLIGSFISIFMAFLIGIIIQRYLLI